MARKPMVTRTLKSTTVVALCMDVVKCEPENKTLTIARTFKDDNSALKVLKNKYETDTLKVVHVVSRTESEELYGMTEEDFIKYAVILDKETRKAFEQAEAETEESAEQAQETEQTTEAEQSAEQTTEAEQSAEQTAEAEQSAEQTAEAEQSAEQGRNRRHNRRR